MINNKKIIDNSDIEITATCGRVYFTFSMEEVKYNKLMNSNNKLSKRESKPPKWAQELITTVKSIDSRLERIENLPTIKKELANNEL